MPDYQNLLNEKFVDTSKLTREGEEFVNFMSTVIREKTIESISFKKNYIEIQFENSVDLTNDLFSFFKNWEYSPAHLDLYIEDISVTKGKLRMMIFSMKASLQFSLGPQTIKF